MKSSLISGDTRIEHQPVAVTAVVVRERQRKLNDAHVKSVLESFESLGGQLQLQPIVVDQDLVLIDGRHRLEAARLAGWEFISAFVLHGVMPDDRALLEAEANRVRLSLTPLEIEEAWRTIYEPAFKARAKSRQAETYVKGNESPVTVNHSNRYKADREFVSVPKAAKQVTGVSLDTINKITDIRELARSESAPDEIREAATKGLQKLQRPNASVDAVHKSLLQLQDRVSRQNEDPVESQRKFLEKRLDQVLTETTLLEGKLAGPVGKDLLAAARVDQMSGEQLRAVRVALTHALGHVVAVECQVSGEVQPNLSRIGGEVTRMLSEETMRELDLEVDHG